MLAWWEGWRTALLPRMSALGPMLMLELGLYSYFFVVVVSLIQHDEETHPQLHYSGGLALVWQLSWFAPSPVDFFFPRRVRFGRSAAAFFAEELSILEENGRC